MKLPLLSSKELCKILNKIGFEEIRQKGSHKYFKHSDGLLLLIFLPINSL